MGLFGFLKGKKKSSEGSADYPRQDGGYPQQQYNNMGMMQQPMQGSMQQPPMQGMPPQYGQQQPPQWGANGPTY